MKSLKQIDADILHTQKELENVHGRTAEVYSRIVGYYRSVKNRNAGKRDEYTRRRLYTNA